MDNFDRSISLFIKSEDYNDSKDINLSTYNWAHLGYAYFNIGIYEKAIDYLTKVFEYDPSDTEIIYRIAKSYEYLEIIDKSIMFYTILVETDKDNFWYAIEATALAIECKLESEVNKFYLIAKNNVSTTIEKIVVESWEYYTKRDKNKTIKLLEESISILNNESKQNLNNNFKIVLLSYYYSILKDKYGEDFSLDVFEKSYLINPFEPHLNYILAKEYCDRNIKLSIALKMINFAIKSDIINPDFFYTKSLILYKLKHYRDARKSLEKMLKNNPNNLGAKELLDKILYNG